MNAIVIGSESAEVRSVPIPPLAKDKLRVKAKAVALNHIEWKQVAFKFGAPGSILGSDVAGEIVEVGSEVKGFKVGELVYSFLHSGSAKTPDNGAFAEYSIVDPLLTLKIPADLKYSGKDSLPAGPVKSIEAAVSLPVSLFTAAAVLVYHLGLKNEWKPAKAQNDKPLLIWGGATSVGQMMIQIAKNLNGFSKIIVVASRKHEQKLKSYGADELFDYHDKDVIEQIKSQYKDLPFLVDAVSAPESFKEVYKLGNTDKPTKLVQLTAMSEELIPEAERNSNITVDTGFLYLALGLEVPMGAFTIPANPAYREALVGFTKLIAPKINDGEIQHLPLKIFHKTLQEIPVVLKELQSSGSADVKYTVVLQ